MRLASLFTAEAPEDKILATIELPRIVVRAATVVVVLSAAIGIVGGLVEAPENTPSNVAFVVAPLLPWLLWIGGVLRIGWAFAGLVLAFPATMAVYLALDGGFTGGYLQYPLNFALVMWILFALAPRRQAAGVFAATYLTFLGLGIAGGSETYIDCIVWMVVLTFVLLALVGVRAGAIEIARVQRRVAQARAADDRRQIARDIHDVVAHTLAVTMLHLTAARMAVNRGATDDATEALDEAERQGLSSLSDVRRVLQLLGEDSPAGIADIPDLVAGYRNAGLRVGLTREGVVDGVSAGDGLTVYRVVQEALANATRHGDGSASVDLRLTGGGVELTVRNPVRQPAATPSNGNGIRGMRERVEAAGGAISVGPVGNEWRVHVVLATASAEPGATAETEAEAVTA